MHLQYFMNMWLKHILPLIFFLRSQINPLFLLSISQNKPFTSAAVPSQYCVPKNISFLFSFVRFPPPPPKKRLPLTCVWYFNFSIGPKCQIDILLFAGVSLSICVWPLRSNVVLMLKLLTLDSSPLSLAPASYKIQIRSFNNIIF